VYVYIYVDVKTVVRVKNIIKIKKIISQGHELLNFWKWLQALTLLFPACKELLRFFLFFKLLGKTKIFKS